MPKVLTMASTVTCGHQGTIQVTGSPKLTVGGDQVLLKTGIDGKAVATNCTIQPSSTTSKCTAVTSLTAGESTKLSVGGVPVMLDMLAGTSNGVPIAPLASPMANQSTFNAV